MKDEIVVKRYAEAFLSYAKERIGLDRAVSDLVRLDNNILHENTEFIKFLRSFEITYAEKCDVVDKVLNSEFSDEIKNFVKLLLAKGRVDKLQDIVDYVRIKLSVWPQPVLLRLTYPLGLRLLKRLEDELQNKFKKKFKFYVDLDSSLLGGMQVVVGNTVIDCSLRRRLDELKEKLKTVRVANGS